MRSPAESRASRDESRRRVELGLRAVGFSAIVAALLLLADLFDGGARNARAPFVLRDESAAPAAVSLVNAVRSALLDAGASVAADASPRAIHLVARRVPDDTSRALVSAARSAGVPVTWTDSTRNAAVAVEVQPLIDPRGGYTLRVAAPTGVTVALRDSIGLIDSIRTNLGGGETSVGRVAGSVRAVSGVASAAATAPIAPDIRRVLLFAEPGWEAKFTMAALEERGWKVEARYAIGRNVTVTQGAPAAPDTSRYALVVALDSSARAHAAAIRRYAASGGGVIFAGPAITLREFGEMIPGRAATRHPGVPGALETAEPRSGLAWRPITADSNAAIIEHSARVAGAPGDTRTNAAVVARRFGAGRVAAIAYDGLWEWRMAGPEGSVDAHRQWWSAVASSVAFAPERSRDSAGAIAQTHADEPGRAAPYADTRMRLGAPTSVPAVAANPAKGFPWELLLVSLASLCLVFEWASRRLRGAR